MVQVKKDEIKQAIENAATDTFLEKGYLNTKMRSFNYYYYNDIKVGN